MQAAVKEVGIVPHIPTTLDLPSDLATAVTKERPRIELGFPSHLVVKMDRSQTQKGKCVPLTVRLKPLSTTTSAKTNLLPQLVEARAPPSVQHPLPQGERRLP
jgi:hypothetical protein